MLTGDNSLPFVHHKKYYIPGGDLFIVVEKILFRVDSYFFQRESDVFAKLITPVSPGAQSQGSDASTAIILDELSAEDFAKFLWVFYNPLYSLYDAAVEDWEVILTLSDRWSFPEVKNLAIRELEKKTMPDVKRIKLYQKHNVDRNYLIPSYIALCEREEPLTVEEGLDLGITTVTQIVTTREQIRRTRASYLPIGTKGPLTPTIHGSDLHEVIRQLFNIAPPEIVSTDETSNFITDALPTPATIQSTLFQVKQPIHEEEQIPPQRSKPKQKKGTKKVKQLEIKTLAPQQTTVIPQKPAAALTPTPTRMKIRPRQVAEETEDETKPKKLTSEAEGDAQLQKVEEDAKNKSASFAEGNELDTRYSVLKG